MSIDRRLSVASERSFLQTMARRTTTRTEADAFGSALRELRTKIGVSQMKLALDAEIDRAFVGHMERGTKTPTLRTIMKLSRALGISSSVLLERTEYHLARK